MKASSRIQRFGFTLIELMTVLAIIGTLACVAVPLFDHYIAESRKPEAHIFLKMIADGALSYYETEHVFDKDGNTKGAGFYVSSKEYPSSTGALSDALGSMPYKSDFTMRRSPNDPNVVAKLKAPPWNDLKVRISSPFYYSYNYQAGDMPSNQQFKKDERARDRNKKGNIYFDATAGACISRICKDRDQVTRKFLQPCDSGYVIVGGPKGKVSNILDNSNWTIETDCGKALMSNISKNKQIKELWLTL